MARQPAGAAGDRGKECAVCAAVASVCRTVDRHAATKMRGSAAVLVCVGLGRQTGGLPGLLQCASGPCVVGRADARPDTKGCRTARPLPMGRALPWSLSDADRGVTSDQRRRWRAGRRARVRRLSRHSRAVRQLHALLMPSRQLRGGDSRLTGPEDRTMSDSYEFATHTSARTRRSHVRSLRCLARRCASVPAAGGFGRRSRTRSRARGRPCMRGRARCAR